MRKIAQADMGNSAYVGCHLKFGWKSLEQGIPRTNHLDTPRSFKSFGRFEFPMLVSSREHSLLSSYVLVFTGIPLCLFFQITNGLVNQER